MQIQRTIQPQRKTSTLQKQSQATSEVRANPQPTDTSELSDLIGPEPKAPPASAYRSAVKGAVIGALAGAAIGYGTRELYSSSMGIPTASKFHFAGLLGGGAVGAVAGQGMSPAFDPEMRAVLVVMAGLTFTLASSTLGAAGVVGAAALYGGFMGGAFGFTAELLRSQAEKH